MQRASRLAAMLLIVLSSGVLCSWAQTATATKAPTPAPADQVPTSGPVSVPRLTTAELEKLVAPIALYPDVLVAQLLPASTFPTDIVMAARWVRTKPDLTQLDTKPWDDTVKALCHYPDVLYKLDEDLEWTNALGAAFLEQQDGVMNAIQTCRLTAQSRDLLQTNEKQTIVVEQDTIQIMPTEANTVYVPTYSPQVVYVEDDDDAVWASVASTAIGFGAGVAMGAWLNMDCYWHGGFVHGCYPGHYAGWAHSGAVAWGPRGVAAVGPNRGFVAGPRGAAAYGPNGAAAWRRPATASALPAYSGRYASYGSRYGGNYYGGRNVTNNVNVNRNNSLNRNTTNIDRGDRTNIGSGNRNIGGGDRTNIGGGDRTKLGGGDRTNIGGGDRTNVGGGDRTKLGGDRTSVGGGDRTNVGGRPGGERPAQLPANAGNRASSGARPSQQPSAFNSGTRSQPSGQASQRGQQSRQQTARPSATPSQARPAPQQARPSSPPRSSSGSSSAFNSRPSGGSRPSGASSRGAASRGGGGGGGRGGGGGGRR
jgi:hypothetical protein